MATKITYVSITLAVANFVSIGWIGIITINAVAPMICGRL